MILRCTGKDINGLIGYLGTDELPDRMGPSALVDVSSPFYTLWGENEVKGMTLVPDTNTYYLSDRDLPAFKNRVVAKTGDLSSYADESKFNRLKNYLVTPFSGSTLRIKNIPSARNLTRDMLATTLRPVEVGGQTFDAYKSYQATALASMLELLSRVKYVIAVISNDALSASVGLGVPVVTDEWYTEHFSNLIRPGTNRSPRLSNYSSTASITREVPNMPKRCLPLSKIPFNAEPAKFYIHGVELQGSICDTCTECSDREKCPSYSSLYPQSFGCAYKTLTKSHEAEGSAESNDNTATN